MMLDDKSEMMLDNKSLYMEIQDFWKRLYLLLSFLPPFLPPFPPFLNIIISRHKATE